MKKILVVDMGWGGAAAYWVEEESIVGLRDCPSDALGIYEFIKDLIFKYGPDWDIILEANTPSPKFGAKGNFGLGRNIGSWEAALAAAGLSWEDINPRAWQKILTNIKSSHRKGRKAIKEKSWRYARRNFPKHSKILGDKVPSPRNQIQGYADALCILDWRRKDVKNANM